MLSTSKITFHGGPLDGKTEWRELHPSQSEIRVFLPPPPPTTGNENQRMQTGRYVKSSTHEGLSVFEWKGVSG